MNSHFHDLQNSEAILLMYLSNELPAQDREEVEHMLNRDVNLRLELARIRADYEDFHETMHRMDAATPPTSPFAAARSVGDVLRGRQDEPASVDEHEETRRRIPWAIYPAAAAAAVAMGMFLWWRSASDELGKPPDVIVYTGGDPNRPDGRRFGGSQGIASNSSTIADMQILRVFDPLVLSGSHEPEQQLSAIHFLKQSLQ